MLLTKEILVKINFINKSRYEKILNKKLELNEEVYININYFKKNAKIRVDIACDICNRKTNVSYTSYNNCFDYGFYSCIKCKRIKQKMTMLTIYGIDNYFNTDKTKKTHEEKYGGFNNNREKSKKTCLNKYGVDNVSKSDIIKLKREKTNIINWGVKNVFQSEIIKNKSKLTNFKILGVYHNSQSSLIKEIKKATCVKNSGYEYPMQNLQTFIKQKKSSYNKKKIGELHYQGTYELDFINFCIKNNILIENASSVRYYYDDEEHIYFPDFYLPEYNLICEIKSKYYFNKDYDKNLVKREYTIKNGYNFEFIIDKNYENLIELLTI